MGFAKINKQLLIIGNGFDLYCGIQSSFIDYLNNSIDDKKYKLLEEWIENTQKAYENKEKRFFNFEIIINHNKDLFINYELEIILLLIANRETVQWADFEKAIYNLIVEIKEENGKHLKSVWEDAFAFYSSKSFVYDRPNGVARILGNMCFLIDLNRGNMFITTNYEDWKKRLVNLISSFEKRFANYLVREFNKKNIHDEKDYPYIERLHFLLSRVAKEELELELDILNFNYTQPKFECTSIAVHKVEHVHGRIDDTLDNQNIIIGIDSVNLSSNNFGYQLTKTYRKAKSLGYNEGEKPLDLIDVANTKIIKFFGHSLNEQDYSYFQSIFDMFSLYDSEVELKFYFTIYDQSKEIEIRDTAIKQIVNLIEVYGKTLNNKDQGKNLLHKLLLQSRLSIIEIPYKELIV